jgi:hypothetical protein
MSTMCPLCQSKQTTEKHSEKRIYLYCRMCRRETTLVEGTKKEIARHLSMNRAIDRRRRAEDRRSNMDR